MIKPLLSLATVALFLVSSAGAAELKLQPGERVVFVGNTFAEALVDDGYFEAALTSRFPGHKLSFRNLAWSADSLTQANLRPLNFADQMAHLHHIKPDVLFAFYGMVESFAGAEGLARFEEALTKWVEMQLSMNYSGNGVPRVVLVSPIAHEALGGKLPDPAAHNEQLAAYTAVMRKVAGAQAANGVSFVDLFTPTQQLMVEGGARKLTINGIHLNGYGNWKVAQIMMEQLGLGAAPARVELAAEALPLRINLPQTSLPLPNPAALAGRRRNQQRERL
jgi:hypothetical protein